MRAFMSSFASSTFNVSKCAAGLDNSYIDLLTVDTNSKMTIKGSSSAASGLYWIMAAAKYMTMATCVLTLTTTCSLTSAAPLWANSPPEAYD